MSTTTVGALETDGLRARHKKLLTLTRHGRPRAPRDTQPTAALTLALASLTVLPPLLGYVRYFLGGSGLQGGPRGLWCTKSTPKPRSTPVNGGMLRPAAAYPGLKGPVIPGGLEFPGYL